MTWQGYFQVACCGRRRGLINGTLICPTCDYIHDHATVIPNEHQTHDVPADTWYLYPNGTDRP